MERKWPLVFSLFLVAFCWVVSQSAYGQIATATIFGTVKDVSGAVIPGASVTVTNQSTGITRKSVTSGSGDYVVPQLLPGTYNVTASKSGFETRTVSDVVLNVTARQGINLTLPVGQVTQEVTVQASPVHLATGSSALGQVVTEKDVTNLPLNGRNFVQLAALGTGAAPIINGGRQDEGTNHAHTTVGVNISGGRGSWSSWLVDGVETKNNWFNTPSILPSVDSIQEFRVMSANAPAQYGGAENFINVVTKSGTNKYHGDVYEFIRNNHLDARNFFDSTTPQYKQNQFGGTIGGPIVHNRAFFFFGYEGLRTRQGNTIIATVPLPSQLGGDFSALSTPIIDPTTGQAFTNNIIPPTSFSTVAKNFLQYIPAPNHPGTVRNLVVAPGLTHDFNQYVGRADYRLSAKDQMFGRFLSQKYNITSPGFAPLFGSTVPFSGKNFTLQETHTFGANAVNSFKLSYNRGILLQSDELSSQDLAAQLGLTGIGFPNALPGFSITGFSGMGGGALTHQGGVTNRYQVSDTFDIVKGKHELAAGADFRMRQFQNNSPLNGNGSFTFDGRYTGNSLADFLLGLPAQAAAEAGTDIANLRSKEWGIFIQDDYKATQKLTLNMGLRWDFFGPWSEIDNKEGVFDPTYPGGRFLIGRNPSDFGITFDPAIASRFVVGGVRRGIVDPQYNNWAPRFGLAYHLFRNTVIRSAYGMFYVEPNGNEQSAKQKIPPFAVTRRLTGTPSTPLYMDTLFPSGAFLSGVLAPQGGLQRHARTPRMQQWNFSIQQQIHNTLVQVGYAGSVGTYLSSRVNVNQAVPSPPNTVTPVQPRRPYPLFADILKRVFRDRSHYHSLQVKVQQSPWHGLGFLASYTYSKAMDTQSRVGATEHQNSYNLDADMGLSSYDMRHIFNFSYTYTLPFGQGKQFLGNATGALGKLASGWQVNGITTLLAGLPFNPTAPGSLANVGGFTALRADCVGDWHLPNPTPNEWFNKAAFALPAFGVFGNCGRNFVIGPGTTNFDFSAFKSTRLTEGTTLQFRAEFFNAFNHPNFNLPNANRSSGTFGEILSARSPREIQFALKLLF